jgi:hypothetical protein
MNMQINQTKQVSYGATEHVPGNPFNQAANVYQPTAPANSYQQPTAPTNPYQATQSTNPYNPNPGNPFAFPNSIQEEPVQPNATDAYMHGNVEDRGFRQY